MNLIYNLFKYKNCSMGLTFLPPPIGPIFDKFKILISFNFLDMSLCKEIINLLLFHLDNEATDYTNEELLTALRKEINSFFYELRQSTKLLKKELDMSKVCQILNMTTFFYILVTSMKNYKNFFEVFFDKSSPILVALAKLLENESVRKLNPELMQLISSFFERGLVKETLQQFNLEDLFTYHKNRLYVSLPELELLKPTPSNEVTVSIYKKLLENIVNIDLCYEIFFIHKIDLEERSLIKSQICQAAIRIVFSQEKYKFLNSSDHIQYELSFLKNLSRKCVSFYFNKFGENVNCLFRKDQIYDDLVKYIFFTSANILFYSSFYTPLKRIIDSYSDKDSETELKNLSIEEFIEFYENLLGVLKVSTPNVIKLVLRLLYENVLQMYSQDNFTPVLTILFFNFLLSPKIQEIYNINPIKNALVKNLNRLIRNICFNEKFKEEDPMKYYNDIVEICHLHTKSTIDKIINSFLLEDMDFLLKSEMANNWQYLTIPVDVFYHDCDYVINLLEKSMSEENLVDITEEVDFIEKMMKNRKNSFYLKINLEDFKKLKILEQMQTKDDVNEVGY